MKIVEPMYPFLPFWGCLHINSLGYIGNIMEYLSIDGIYSGISWDNEKKKVLHDIWNPP